MSTNTRIARTTLATAAAFAVAGAGVIAGSPVAEAAAKPKVVSIKPTQYPKLIDEPGAASDVIRLTYVPGVKWLVGGDTNSPSFGGSSVVDVPVATGDVKVTAAPATDPTIDNIFAPGTPIEWNYTAENQAEVEIDASGATPIWNDVPGAKDFVTLTKIKGIKWTYDVDGAGDKAAQTFDVAAFGTKDSLRLAATKDTTVTAEIITGYQPLTGKELPTAAANTLTDTDTVAVPDAVLKAAVEVGENPHDAHKGYGPGAAYETVKITGVEGVKWKVGSAKAVVVKGTQYVKVNPDDLDAGKVTVTAEAAGKKYTVTDGWKKDVDFTDATTVPTVSISNDLITKKDLAGSRSDVLTLKAQPGMVWWVGQAGTKKDASGTPIVTYKAMKPGKNGLVTVKPSFPKATADLPNPPATVHLKPVANRGYVTENVPDKDGAEFATEVKFTSDSSVVALTNQGVASGSKVTYTPAEGVSTWTTSYEVTSGTKKSTKKATVKALDITNINAKDMVIDYGTSTPLKTDTKVLKDYSLAK